MLCRHLTSAAALAALAAALAAAPARADATLFLGPDGGVGDVVVVDEAGLQPPAPVPGLDGIALLPLDASGRTRLETFLPGSPRRLTDVPGAARIRLPAGAGSLYHFRRDLTGGGAEFGYFAVDANGAAARLVAVGGIGAAGDQDPFLAGVACDPAGTGVLVATLPAAGGNVLELDLATGTAIDRTPNLPPIAVQPSGLGLRATFGAIAGQNGLLRFARQPGAVATGVVLPGAPTWFGGEFVFSGNGLVVATIAGSSQNQSHPFAFGPIGPAVRLDATPRALSSAGFLPAVVDGPYMTLSHDGSVCLWCSFDAATNSREAWTTNVALAPTPAQSVTADSQFVDTLDEVGLAGALRPISDRAIVVAVGERADPVDGGVEGIDFYLVETPAAGGPPTLTNLTLTSQVAAEPFVKGNFEPSQGTYRVPGRAEVLVRDDEGSGGRLTLVDLVTGQSQVVVPGAEELLGIEWVGDRFFTVTQGDLGGPEMRDVSIVDPATASAIGLGTFPTSASFDRFAVHPDGWIGFAATLGGQTFVARTRASTGFSQLLTTLPVDLGPTLAFTPGDRLVLTGSPSGPDRFAFGWGLETASFLAALPGQPCSVLPGR